MLRNTLAGLKTVVSTSRNPTGIRRKWGLVGWFPNKEPQRTPDQFWGCSSGGVLFLRVLDLGSTQRIPFGGGGLMRVELSVEFHTIKLGGVPEDRRFSSGKKPCMWGLLSTIIRRREQAAQESACDEKIAQAI